MADTTWFFRKEASRAEKLYTCLYFGLLAMVIYSMGWLSYHSTSDTRVISWLPVLPLSVLLLVPLFRDKQVKANLKQKKPAARLFFYSCLIGFACLLSFAIFKMAIPSIYTRFYGTDTTAVAELKHKHKKPSKLGGTRCYQFSLHIPPHEKLRHKCVDEGVWEKARLGDRFDVDLRSTQFGFLIGNIER